MSLDSPTASPPKTQPATLAQGRGSRSTTYHARMPDSVPDCLFCRIVAGAIPARRLHETPDVLAFADLHPQAPTHILLIPKRHIASHAHALPEDASLLGSLLAEAGELARNHGLARGYRLVVNTGPDGGQTVDHLHIHLLGGRPMTWPPG